MFHRPQPVVYHSRAPDLGACPRASFSQRAYALALDVAFLLPVLSVLRLPFARQIDRLLTLGKVDVEGIGILSFLLLISVVLVFVGPTAATGQSLGKAVVGLRVVTRDYEERLPFHDVLIRETLGKLFSVLLLFSGFFVVLFDPGRRAFHDRLSRTLVIDCRGG